MPLRARTAVRRSSSLLFGVVLAATLLSCGGDGGSGPDQGAPSVLQMVSGNDQSGAFQTSLANPLVVEVLDARGRAVGGQTVTWTVVEGGGSMSPASSITNASGEAHSFLKVGSSAGLQRVRASVAQLPTVDFTATATSRPAALVTSVSGNNQSARAGTQLAQPLVARVTDATGAPIAGATVTFAVASGAGVVQPATATTDASGQASASWTLGPAAGQQTVSATAAGAGAALFTATATENPSTLSLVAGGGQTGAVASVLATPVRVRLVGGGGAPVIGATVLFSTSGTNGTATPASATTDANGEASATWRLGTVAGAQTLGVSSTGAPSISIGATAVAAAASQLTIVSGNNQVGAKGQPLALPAVVRVSDAWDNPVAGVAVSFAATSGGGSLTPAGATTDAAGRASAVWTLGTASAAQGAVATVATIGNAVFAATATPPIAGLAHRVVDAEYNAATNRIITISANPSRLHIIDPETKAVQTIDLAQVPNAVSVRADGQYAAVGHNAWISYVNLATRQVERVYPVTTDVIDIVLGSNGWVYAFPRTDQWETIRSIELATGAETRTGTIRAGTIVKLHPSGKYIYGANNGLSPSDFEKYDIRSGAAIVMYDSPYHGDYAFSGDLWIAEDGLRVFARSGNVFRSSEVRAEDLLYAGKLQGMTVVQWAAQSTAAGRVFALPGSSWDTQAASELRVYESAVLGYRGAAALPRFVVSGVGTFASEGRYVFPSANGQRIYCLVKADNASGLAQDWGLVTYDLADLP